MSWYKIAKNDIHFLGDYNYSGAMFVNFKVGDSYWVYRLSFIDHLNKVKQIAYRSSSKALDFAKKNKVDAFKVTKNWPIDGTIEREEFTKDEIEERSQQRKTPKPIQQELDFSV